MKKTECERGSLGGKLFRRLLAYMHSFQEAVSLQGRDAHVSIGVPRDSYYNYQKEIETALLEAERKKTETIEWQRRNIVC